MSDLLCKSSWLCLERRNFQSETHYFLLMLQYFNCQTAQCTHFCLELHNVLQRHISWVLSGSSRRLSRWSEGVLSGSSRRLSRWSEDVLSGSSRRLSSWSEGCVAVLNCQHTWAALSAIDGRRRSGRHCRDDWVHAHQVLGRWTTPTLSGQLSIINRVSDMMWFSLVAMLGAWGVYI